MYFVDESNIITTEHGPKGGDEINVLDLKKFSIKILGGQFHHMVIIMILFH